MITYSKQTISSSDIQAVAKALRSDWLTTGPMVQKFENVVTSYVGARYAVAVANGTAALHAACFAAGIGKDDEVITTPYTFIATANSVLYQGGLVKFADISPDTLTIDASKIKTKITPKTKAIIAIDFSGLPADWDRLKTFAKSHKLTLISDAAHSLGASYHGRKVGTLADLSCFSFHPVKTITTGEGGMITTNNKRFYERLLVFRNHGITRKSMESTGSKQGIKGDKRPWFFEMKELGLNYRLTDIQCALGLSQMRHINAFLKKRRELAYRYHKLLEQLPHATLPREPQGYRSSWHLYPLRLDFKQLGKTKSQLFAFMARHGIKLQVHYIPVHLHPYYREHFGFKPGDFPIAEEAYDQEVSLPLYPTLTYSQQDKVIKLLKQFTTQ